jgi:hypothetical protein
VPLDGIWGGGGGWLWGGDNTGGGGVVVRGESDSRGGSSRSECVKFMFFSFVPSHRFTVFIEANDGHGTTILYGLLKLHHQQYKI